MRALVEYDYILLLCLIVTTSSPHFSSGIVERAKRERADNHSTRERREAAGRETEDNAYAKFWGDKQRALWYVMVFLEWSIGDYLWTSALRLKLMYICNSNDFLRKA